MHSAIDVSPTQVCEPQYFPMETRLMKHHGAIYETKLAPLGVPADRPHLIRTYETAETIVQTVSLVS